MIDLFKNTRNAAHKTVASGLPDLLPRLWRFGYNLSASADLADDLVQETCARALAKAAQFTPGTRLDSWTFRICRSIWLNDIRARNVRRGTGVLPVEELDLIDSSVNTEMNIFASQIVNHVMALPDVQRETVFLVYVEGFSYREASEILDIPIGTVMSRLSSARQKLAHLGDNEIAAVKQKGN